MDGGQSRDAATVKPKTERILRTPIRLLAQTACTIFPHSPRQVSMSSDGLVLILILIHILIRILDSRKVAPLAVLSHVTIRNNKL